MGLQAQQLVQEILAAAVVAPLDQTVMAVMVAMVFHTHQHQILQMVVVAVMAVVLLAVTQ